MLKTLISILVFISSISNAAQQDTLKSFIDTQVKEWRFSMDSSEAPQSPGFDDSKWETVRIGHSWWPSDSTCWFRTDITIPETIMGFPTKGEHIRLMLGVDNAAVVYVNGIEKQRFAWGEGDVILTEKAIPGEVIHVAIRGINKAGFGKLLDAYLGTESSLACQTALKNLMNQIALIETHITDNDLVWKKAIADAYTTIPVSQMVHPDSSKPITNDIPASVTQAESILLHITDGTLDRLSRLQPLLGEIDAAITHAQEKGNSADYLRLKARVIRSFIDYAKDDYKQSSFWHKVRAERIVSYFEALSKQALLEARDINANPDAYPAVPRYQTGPVDIHDGAFWQQGHPVYFNGMGHFGQVKKDIPIFQDYGFNIIQIEIGPNSLIQEDGSVSYSALDESILKPLKEAEEHNIAVCVLLSPHYLPDWAMKKYPELADGGHGFIKYDIDHPAAREILEKFLRVAVPKIAAYKSLHSFCLSNEPQYLSRSKISAALFHQWLKVRYKDIAAQNTLYKTRYTDFSEVPQATRSDSDPAYIDWCEFNQERFRDWHRWMADIIHQLAPQIPVHAKSMADAWGGAEHFQLGVNHEDFAHLGQITGNDCVNSPVREKENHYAQDWLRQAMHYDFQHSVAPDQPIFNTENHLIPDDVATFTPGGHIYTALWQGAVYGMGASATWVWDRGEGTTLYDNILTRPNCVEAAGRAGLDLMRLGPVVSRFASIKPEAGLLYAWHSQVRNNEHRDASITAYEGLANLGVRIKIVTENTIRTGALDGLPLLVMAKTSRVHPETAKCIAAYIQNGGTVLTLEPCLTLNEYGQSRPDWVNILAEGEKSGRVIRLNTPVTARVVADLVGERFKQMGRGTPVKLTDPYRDALWGVLWLVLEDDGRYVVNVVNMNKDAKHVRLPLSAQATAKDLISGKIMSREFILPPLCPMLLEIGKKDLEP